MVREGDGAGRQVTSADFQYLHKAITQLSRDGTRSITIPNGDVPVIIAALAIAADRAT